MTIVIPAFSLNVGRQYAVFWGCTGGYLGSDQVLWQMICEKTESTAAEFTYPSHTEIPHGRWHCSIRLCLGYRPGSGCSTDRCINWSRPAVPFSLLRARRGQKK